MAKFEQARQNLDLTGNAHYGQLTAKLKSVFGTEDIKTLPYGVSFVVDKAVLSCDIPPKYLNPGKYLSGRAENESSGATDFTDQIFYRIGDDGKPDLKNEITLRVAYGDLAMDLRSIELLPATPLSFMSLNDNSEEKPAFQRHMLDHFGSNLADCPPKDATFDLKKPITDCDGHTTYPGRYKVLNVVQDTSHDGVIVTGRMTLVQVNESGDIMQGMNPLTIKHLTGNTNEGGGYRVLDWRHATKA